MSLSGVSLGVHSSHCDPEIDRLLSEPPLAWDDVLDDPEIRARVGQMIAAALLRRNKPDPH